MVDFSDDNSLFDEASRRLGDIGQRKVEGSGMTSEVKSQVLTVLLWACGIYVTVNSLVLGWIFTEVLQHNTRLVAIESNRFTSRDGQVIYDRLHELSISLSRFPAKFPPDWFLARYNKTEGRIDKLEERMNEQTQR